MPPTEAQGTAPEPFVHDQLRDGLRERSIGGP
jgi:hypothetical protein